MPEPHKTHVQPAAIRKSGAFVFVTVVIDAMGIGIIMPVMPDLLQELSASPISEAAFWGGALSFIYAVMQFLFSPAIGNLSDRFGRRPVLLTSLATLAVDYVVMGFAPTLWMLFVSRAIAGVAGATYSTATAFIADVSAPKDRAKNFGLVGAGFGVGFVLGPVVGGLVGELGVRQPFFAAAALAGINVLYGAFVLPESLPPEKRRPFDVSRANPLGALRQITRLPGMGWFVASIFLYNIAHMVYPAVWSFFTKERFGWTTAEVGLSLAAVGIGFAIVQGLLMRWFLSALGEARTVLVGLAVMVVGLVGLAFATRGWMLYALIPLTTLGAVVSPAMKGLMANRVGDDAQGELQGLLSSAAGITSIISPLLMTQLFGHFSKADAPVYFPGAPFAAAALLTIVAALPLSLGLRLSPKRT